MSNIDIINKLTEDENILLNELSSYGSVKAKEKNKYSCPFCSSSDGLGIISKNGKYHYKCFSCQVYGDVINLVSVKEGIEQGKAINITAKNNGIELHNRKYSNEEKKEFAKKKKEKELKKIEEDKPIFIKEIEKYHKKLKDSLVYNKNGTVSIDQLKAGKAILEEYDFINNERFLYKYNEYNGVWEKTTKQGIRTIITNDLEQGCNYWSDGTSRSLSNYIYDKTYGNVDGLVFDEVFNKNPYSVVFTNGTLDLKTGKFDLLKFNKDDFNTIYIPHEYNSEAEYPHKSIEFMKMMIPNEKELDFILEWFGYQFVKSYPITKMLFIQGGGGNGKSTLIKIMSALVGASNVSNVSMKSLVNNRFQSALLYNKLTNTVADIGADFFDDSSIIKALTGDDRITVERKGENGFDYLNFAKMTYSCNALPRFKDNTGGLNRRPIVLQLNEDFTTKVKNSNIHVNDIINDEAEMERLIKLCTDKFMNVIKKGYDFTESESMIQAKNDWLTDDPIVDFIEEVFEFVDNDKLFTEMATFMGLYKIYCQDRNYKPMSQKNVVEAIKSNKKLTDKGIEIKRLNNKTKYLKVTNLIKIIEDAPF